MNTQGLGDRIKSMYESRTRVSLPRRVYTILRIDGKNFSNYTRRLNKPFDLELAADFDETARGLCAEIMGCRMAYTQSDEITLVLSDFESANSDAWFDGNLQKIVSVSASMATVLFNRARLRRTADDRWAYFDARAFTIADREDVINCLKWRQADAVRNSISMIARTILSHKEMDGVGVAELRTILKNRGVDLNSYPDGLLRGRIVSKETYLVNTTNTTGVATDSMTQRSRWAVSTAPIFTENGISADLVPERTAFGRNSQ